MWGFLVTEALRDLRRAGRVALAAVLLITLSLAALGGFRLVSVNLERAVAGWRDRVRVVLFLRSEPARAEAEALVRRVGEIPGVQRVRYVSKAEALESLRASLGGQAGIVDQLPRNPLPASLEVTPDAAAATPEGTRALIERVGALPEVEEVQGGLEWIEGLARWQRLLQLAGLGVGALLALAAILTVTTATTLVLHARREEMEIMRLVGATESTIRLPLLLQGLVQGLAGAVVALAALHVGFTVAAPRLEPLLRLTLGLPGAAFLPPVDVAALLGGGTALGALGGLLARGRSAA